MKSFITKNKIVNINPLVLDNINRSIVVNNWSIAQTRKSINKILSKENFFINEIKILLKIIFYFVNKGSLFLYSRYTIKKNNVDNEHNQECVSWTTRKNNNKINLVIIFLFLFSKKVIFCTR